MGYIRQEARLQLVELFELFVRNYKFLCSLSNLFLQAGISRSECDSHLVELFRKNLNFISGVEFQPKIQIALSDSLHSLAQPAKRADHPTRQKQARQKR